MINSRTELVELILKLNLPPVAAEIGVAEGLFSRDLLNLGIKKLYSIDSWKQLKQNGDGGFTQKWHDMNYNSAVDLLKPFLDNSIILKGKSNEMAKHIMNNELSLLYIDGDHSYDGVISDLNNYYEKVIPGGIISGHDYLNLSYGVNNAVQDFCKKMNLVPITINENNINDASFYIIKE